MHSSTKNALIKQASNVDALLFESAGACEIPATTNDLDCGLVNTVRFLFLNLDFNF